MPSSAWRTRLAFPPSATDLPCRAVPGQPGARGQGWMLPRISTLPGMSTQRWARGGIAPAKVARSRRSRNNAREQEVISRGKRFNGSVTWYCTKTQPRAAAASWGGCRAPGDAWEAVPCRAVPRRARGAHGRAVRAEPGAAAARPALSRRLKVVLF